MCLKAHKEARGQLPGVRSLLYYAGVRGPTQVIGLCSECLNPQSHLTSLQPGLQKVLAVIWFLLTEARKKYTVTEFKK